MEALLANPAFVVIAALAIILILMYNNLNSRKRRVEKSWANIDVYLQERTTMIKTLLSNSMEVLDKESDAYKGVAALRTGISNYDSKSINEKIQLDQEVKKFITVTAEAYPQIKSIDLYKLSFKAMISEEKQIGAARRQYNSNATSYNAQITSFPTSLVAGIFGFREEFELFKLDEAERQRMTSGDDLSPSAMKIAQAKAELEVAKINREIEKVKNGEDIDE